MYQEKRYSYIRILLVFGLALLTLAFVIWTRIVTPQLLSLPDTFHYEADIVSKDNFYDETRRAFQGEAVSVTRFYYEVEEKKGRNLIIKNVFDVRRTTGERIFAVERKYGIDPLTGTHVAGFGDHDRTGYLFAPRHLEEKKDFVYWHINYDEPARLHFKNEETINGLTVYRYETNYHADQTNDLTHLPGVPDKRGVNLDINLQVWVEPLTGHMIKYQDHTTAYYYDRATGKRLFPWNQFTNSYTEESVNNQVKIAEGERIRQFTIESFVPGVLIFLILGELMLLYINLKKKIHPTRFSTHSIITAGLFPVLFMIMMTMVVSAWKYAQQSVEQRAETQFEEETKSIDEAILKRIEIYKNALEATRGLFVASELVTRNEWARFVKAIDIQNNYPGIQAMSFAQYIPAADKAKHIQAIRAEGFKDYEIRPLGTRSEYLPVVYIEPFADRNLRAFGYDLLAEPVRKNAIIQAQKSGLPTLSGKMVLIQDQDITSQPGFLMIIPIYKNGSPIVSVEDRTQAIVGFITSPFRVNDFMRGVFNARTPNIHFDIYDGLRVDKEKQLYEEEKGSNIVNNISYTPRFSKTKTVYVIGHPWTISYITLPGYSLNNADELLPTGVLIGGTIFSVLIILFIYALASSRRRALEYARRLTQNLEESKKQLINAQRIAKIGSWEWDVKTNKIIWSDELYRIFGVDPNQFTATYEQYLTFIHPDDRERVDTIVKKALKDFKPYEFYHRIIRPDGVERTLQSKGNVVTDMHAAPIKMLGTAQDVTEQKQAEENIRQRTEELERINKQMIGRELQMIELKKKLKDSSPKL